MMKREDVNSLSQLVELAKLKELYNKIDTEFNVKVLTAPTEQTLLVPVKDPISGSDFYSGEVLVTSCIVELKNTKGWAMVMDSNEELSLYTATLDACFEAGILKDEITKLLEDAKALKEEKIKQENRQVNSTRVSFDLM